jgi:putative Ca2+/H+ antiporter (TMEM165/GDT1 family)
MSRTDSTRFSTRIVNYPTCARRHTPIHPLKSNARARSAPSTSGEHAKRAGHPHYGIQLLETLLVSTTVVALGEIGDKTQLLALMLAVRFRKPWPIVAGILVATLVNHTIAGAVGNWVRTVVPPGVLQWLLALSFFAVAAWALKPDRLEEDNVGQSSRLGVFAVTTVAFFLAEMGDKTQIATAVLAARFESLPTVVVGTTLGMLIADVPVVFAGQLAADRIPFKAVRIAAAALFAALGVWVLLAGVPG